jgi:putative SbcD/Mre11-related phosphoesterase
MAVRPPAAAALTFADRAVYLADADTVVVSDLHLGRADASRVAAPIDAAASIRHRVRALLDRFAPATIVFAGDLLHSFDRLPTVAVDAIQGLWADCAAADVEALAVAGNHDSRLADCWPGSVADAVTLDDGTVVCHGHTAPEQRGHRYIVGHAHPAITIEGVKRPCYLFGDDAYRGGELLVLPAFTTLAGGVDITDRRAGDLPSPLVSTLAPLQPVVWDDDGDDALWFPALQQLRTML